MSYPFDNEKAGLEPIKKVNKCKNKATHRFTWPGRDESFICAQHLPKLQGVASAIGMPLQTIPLHESELDGEICMQEAKP